MEKRFCGSSTSSPSSCLWSSNWACLPDDLLGLIIDKLVHDDLFDYFRVSAVCKSWNSVALSHKDKVIQLPWLLNTSGSVVFDCEPEPCFYNLFKNSEISTIRLPYAFKGKMFCGSSHGWLVFLENKFTLTALNPLSGKTIHLPRLPLDEIEEINDEYVVDYPFLKVTFSRDPSSESFEVLAILVACNARVAHLKYGDQSWSSSPQTNFASATFYKNWIFGLSSNGEICSLVVDPCSQVIEINNMDIAVRNPEHWWVWYYNMYFVETTSGDLLIVSWNHRIYKLMIDDSNGRVLGLIPMADLGGDSLFLGCNHSISISASKYPKCKPNFVYYAGYAVVGIDLEDDNREEYFDYASGEDFFTWFMPSIN